MKTIHTLLTAIAVVGLLVSASKADILINAEVLDSGTEGIATVQFTLTGDFPVESYPPYWLGCMTAEL